VDRRPPHQYLIVSYRIKNLRDWRPLFEANLQHQFEGGGIHVFLLTERIYDTRRDCEYPYLITLVAKVRDRRRAERFMAQARWHMLGEHAGIDLTSVECDWFDDRARALQAYQRDIGHEWL
jgi:hypothetical protein